MSCIIYIYAYITDFYYFSVITKLSPTIRHLVYDINFILYLPHYALLSIYSRRANQSKKLCISRFQEFSGNTNQQMALIFTLTAFSYDTYKNNAK